MPKVCYTEKKFTKEHQEVIDKANEIIETYRAQGYDLTLRQMYYQFVSRALIENTDRSYKRLGDIISQARRAGLIDWDAIVDRTRFLRTVSSWDGPEEIVEVSAATFTVDFWKNQKFRPEVWVEKDALVGVIEVACEKWKCPFFSCRGYTSDSEIWGAAQRLLRYKRNGQTPVVIHLGDHDPSGIDMTRDVTERLELFAGREIQVKRIALTMKQVEEVEPPPNPAKVTDSRYEGYQREYGEESWELDALEPDYLANLIAKEMKLLISKPQWTASEAAEYEGREDLKRVASNWDVTVQWLKDQGDEE